MRKTLLILSLIFMSHTWAQTNTIKETKVKEDYKEVFRDYIPKAEGATNDYEKLYTEAEEKQLDNIISAFEKETTIQIRIITMDRQKTSLEDFESLSLHIAEAWGIGKKDRDNGILIAISIGHRSIRIQNGKGIEKMISIDETNKIMDQYFLPEFKKGNYYKGTLEGLNELIGQLKSKIKK